MSEHGILVGSLVDLQDRSRVVQPRKPLKVISTSAQLSTFQRARTRADNQAAPVVLESPKDGNPPTPKPEEKNPGAKLASFGLVRPLCLQKYTNLKIPKR